MQPLNPSALQSSFSEYRPFSDKEVKIQVLTSDKQELSIPLELLKRIGTLNEASYDISTGSYVDKITIPFDAETILFICTYFEQKMKLAEDKESEKLLFKSYDVFNTLSFELLLKLYKFACFFCLDDLQMHLRKYFKLIPIPGEVMNEELKKVEGYLDLNIQKFICFKMICTSCETGNFEEAKKHLHLFIYTLNDPKELNITEIFDWFIYGEKSNREIIPLVYEVLLDAEKESPNFFKVISSLQTIIPEIYDPPPGEGREREGFANEINAAAFYALLDVAKYITTVQQAKCLFEVIKTTVNLQKLHRNTQFYADIILDLPPDDPNTTPQNLNFMLQESVVATLAFQEVVKNISPTQLIELVKLFYECIHDIENHHHLSQYSLIPTPPGIFSLTAQSLDATSYIIHTIFLSNFYLSPNLSECFAAFKKLILLRVKLSEWLSEKGGNPDLLFDKKSSSIFEAFFLFRLKTTRGYEKTLSQEHQKFREGFLQFVEPDTSSYLFSFAGRLKLFYESSCPDFVQSIQEKFKEKSPPSPTGLEGSSASSRDVALNKKIIGLLQQNKAVSAVCILQNEEENMAAEDKKLFRKALIKSILQIKPQGLSLALKLARAFEIHAYPLFLKTIFKHINVTDSIQSISDLLEHLQGLQEPASIKKFYEGLIDVADRQSFDFKLKAGYAFFQPFAESHDLECFPFNLPDFLEDLIVAPPPDESLQVTLQFVESFSKILDIKTHNKTQQHIKNSFKPSIFAAKLLFGKGDEVIDFIETSAAFSSTVAPLNQAIALLEQMPTVQIPKKSFQALNKFTVKNLKKWSQYRRELETHPKKAEKIAGFTLNSAAFFTFMLKENLKRFRQSVSNKALYLERAESLAIYGTSIPIASKLEAVAENYLAKTREDIHKIILNFYEEIKFSEFPKNEALQLSTFLGERAAHIIFSDLCFIIASEMLEDCIIHFHVALEKNSHRASFLKFIAQNSLSFGFVTKLMHKLSAIPFAPPPVSEEREGYPGAATAQLSQEASEENEPALKRRRKGKERVL
ncbi:hypothetical protein [Parachlamydia sp. AcF125]|uniref:hypothetical protein n=1 Tax=Parachlamydia sp. AcF125 TaxID=2795736 RepID=UPI001BC9D020|nr:hypothetical protein [Parachlamydia sp. AcF125]MBS4167650.1 hypothetical protein [Parachlamydia sp. AcF125]